MTRSTIKIIGLLSALAYGLQTVKAQPTDNKPLASATQPPAPAISPSSIFQPSIYDLNIPLNYVRTWDALGAGYTTDAALMAAASAPDGYKHVKETTQYLDGLGRPLQTVSRQASPGANPQDLVAPSVYDAFGREAYKFLPYVAPSSDGSFKSDPFAEQRAFLQNQHPGEQVFYGKTTFEPSPLNRIDKSFAPGNSWAGSEGSSSEHAVQIKYLVNNANDDVRVWEVANNDLSYNYTDLYANIPTTARSYDPGELLKIVTVDEQGSLVVEYKDKDGLIVLKKVLVGNAPTQADYSGYNDYLCTYYVYDDLNRLRCVMQPSLVKDISSQAWDLPSYKVTALCFQYEYDSRNRLIGKKVPGVTWTYMFYDQRDRLVYSQDANMRNKQQWMTTLYDELNRPVATGMLLYTGTHLQLRNHLDAVSTNGYSTVSVSGADAASGPFSTSIHVNGNPLPAGATFIPLTVTYYDNYDWTGAAFTSQYSDKLSAGQNLHADALPSQTNNHVTGLVTGTRTRVLQSPDDLTQGAWTSAVSFYDDKNRTIQVQSTNYKGGRDVATNLYDFTGKVLSSYTAHRNPTANVDMGVLSNTGYDAAGRLLKTEKQIFNQSADATPALATTVSEMAYNATGQLATKTLGQKRDGSGNYTALPLETLDYSYNVRGWLNGINKDFANKTGANAADRWFGLELNYDWGFGTNRFNGNIAGTKWRSRGDGEQRAYGF